MYLVFRPIRKYIMGESFIVCVKDADFKVLRPTSVQYTL